MIKIYDFFLNLKIFRNARYAIFQLWGEAFQIHDTTEENFPFLGIHFEQELGEKCPISGHRKKWWGNYPTKCIEYDLDADDVSK